MFAVKIFICLVHIYFLTVHIVANQNAQLLMDHRAFNDMSCWLEEGIQKFSHNWILGLDEFCVLNPNFQGIVKYALRRLLTYQAPFTTVKLKKLRSGISPANDQDTFYDKTKSHGKHEVWQDRIIGTKRDDHTICSKHKQVERGRTTDLPQHVSKFSYSPIPTLHLPCFAVDRRASDNRTLQSAFFSDIVSLHIQ